MGLKMGTQEDLQTDDGVREYVPSHSARATWKECQRKYYYAYALGLEPDKEESQGRRMGKAFAALLDGQPSGYTELLAEAADQHAYDQMAEELVVIEELVRGYRSRYAERDAGIETEVGFDSPNLGRGFLDGVNGTRGKEDKLYSSRHEISDTDDLLEQISAYFAAMQEAGRPLDVIEYRVTRKPPQIKNRTGKWFRRTLRNPESLDEYRMRLRADIEANPDRYYLSRDFYRTSEQIDVFLKGVAVTKAQINLSYKLGDQLPSPDAAFPQNTNACRSKYGRCEFADLCLKGEIAMPGYREKEGRSV